MKITVSNPISVQRPDVYIARVRATGGLVVVGKYAAITLDDDGNTSAGGGWSMDGEPPHHLFEPLRPGESVTLENS